MAATTLVLAAALAWSTEPGIVCRPIGPEDVAAMTGDPLADGEYRLSRYGDAVPNAAVYELRHGLSGAEVRMVHQTLEHGCTAYATEAQCPRLATAMDTVEQLATMAEREPPQPWPWIGLQTPAHYGEWTLQYSRADGTGRSRRWVDPLPPRTPRAIELIHLLESALADCVDVGRSVRRAGARAEKLRRDSNGPDGLRSSP